VLVEVVVVVVEVVAVSLVVLVTVPTVPAAEGPKSNEVTVSVPCEIETLPLTYPA
jgi:hypothetical protein